MVIKLLSENLYDAYDRFLSNDKNNLFYVSTKYILFLENVLDCKSKIYIVTENDLIIGCLPLMFKDGKLGRVYNSLPFYGSNGGIITNSSDAFNLLLDKYNLIVSNDKVACSNYIENPINKNPLKNKINHDEQDTRIGQFTPLKIKNPNHHTNKELLMNSFHYKTRNSIRKAIKSEISVEIDNKAIKFLKYEHIKGMRRIGGTPKPTKFFDNLLHSFNPGSDFNIFVAKKEGIIVAAVLVFYFNKTIEYFVPVIQNEFKNFQPNSLIIYEAMIDAMNKGYEYWNWGGTWETQTGVQAFKNRWNTINITYKYFITVTNKKIYRCSQKELMKNYNGFYIIPFKKLSK